MVLDTDIYGADGAGYRYLIQMVLDTDIYGADGVGYRYVIQMVLDTEYSKQRLENIFERWIDKWNDNHRRTQDQSLNLKYKKLFCFIVRRGGVKGGEV